MIKLLRTQSLDHRKLATKSTNTRNSLACKSKFDPRLGEQNESKLGKKLKHRSVSNIWRYFKLFTLNLFN